MRVLALIFGLVVAMGGVISPACAQGQVDSIYTVESGDTLYGIAREVGVSVRTLKQWNNLETSTLQVGQTLRVRPPTEEPRAQDASSEEEKEDTGGPETDADTTSPAGSSPYGRHEVEEGDTFVNLALRLGTTSDSLFAMNDSTMGRLPPGKVVRLPRRFGVPTHTVGSGETLYDIAGTYGVSVRALKVGNNLKTDTIQPGQRLKIPRDASEVPASGDWATPDSTGRVAIYPPAFSGRLTASGTPYDPDDFVVSHPSLPFNSVVLLSASTPENHTFARVIDRGPIEEGVLLDVSDAVAQHLSLQAEDVSTVELRVVWKADRTD